MNGGWICKKINSEGRGAPPKLNWRVLVSPLKWARTRESRVPINSSSIRRPTLLLLGNEGTKMVHIYLPELLGQTASDSDSICCEEKQIVKKGKTTACCDYKAPLIEQIIFTAICLFVHSNLLHRRSHKKVGAPTDHLA